MRACARPGLARWVRSVGLVTSGQRGSVGRRPRSGGPRGAGARRGRRGRGGGGGAASSRPSSSSRPASGPDASATATARASRTTGRAGERLELRVQVGDDGPAGVGGRRGGGVLGGDEGLQPVLRREPGLMAGREPAASTRDAAGCGGRDSRSVDALGDLVAVPAGAVLVGEQDQGAGRGRGGCRGGSAAGAGGRAGSGRRRGRAAGSRGRAGAGWPRRRGRRAAGRRRRRGGSRR